MAEEKKVPQQVLINPNTVVGSNYSQFVSVSVTDIDVTLEFVFINPRDNTRAQVVSRVTLPLQVGISLAETIITTNKMRDKMKSGEKNG